MILAVSQTLPLLHEAFFGQHPSPDFLRELNLLCEYRLASPKQGLDVKLLERIARVIKIGKDSSRSPSSPAAGSGEVFPSAVGQTRESYIADIS